MKYLLSSILLVTVLSACNQNKKDTSAETKEKKTVEIENEKVADIYSSYISLKDALVESDSVVAKQAAEKLSADLAVVAGCESTSKYADSVVNGSNLESQRSAFHTISSDIIALMKTTPINSGKIFIQYCPMAENGNGAYWMANSKEIRNPYYGDAMLDCGEVKQELVKK